MSLAMRRRFVVGDTKAAMVGEEPAHLGDAAYVLIAVLFGKAQIGIQSCPDVVAVQDAAEIAFG